MPGTTILSNVSATYNILFHENSVYVKLPLLWTQTEFLLCIILTYIVKTSSPHLSSLERFCVLCRGVRCRACCLAVISLLYMLLE